MPQRYIRLGVLPLDPVLDVIRQHLENPATPNEATFLGTSVKIGSVRLQTFASHPQMCCSDESCAIRATHFAVERTGQPAHANGQSQERYHLNLYGLDAEGQEVLMTHDHTLARGLGGADDLSNTTIMCSPCNARKSKFETRACHQRPSNQAHAMAEDISPQREARTREHMQRMARLKGMSLEAYRIHCEAESLRQPKVSGTTLAKRPVRAKLAKKLEVSPGALAIFKHEHNEYEKAQRRTEAPPAAGPRSEQVESAETQDIPSLTRRRRITP